MFSKLVAFSNKIMNIFDWPIFDLFKLNSGLFWQELWTFYLKLDASLPIVHCPWVDLEKNLRRGGGELNVAGIKVV